MKKYKMRGITGSEYGRENALIEGAGGEIPDLVLVIEQSLADEFGSRGRDPDQMDLEERKRRDLKR